MSERTKGRSRDERGNSCLGLIVVVIAFIFLLGMCSGGVGDSDDCYHTPGAQRGSAQDQRDVQRCIEG